MATGDHADVPFLQAAKYARGRADGPPLWIVVHTMQEDELGDTAENVANYFAFHTGTRSVSAHYTIDNNSTVQCVRLADTAWTVGNRPGNNRGINYELAGFAEQTRAQWADAYSTSMLRRFAEVARRDMARYDIPARWCTDDDLRARRPGLTTHAQLGEVFGGTTHWDPGTNFPFDGFLSLIGEELDVDEATLRTIIREETAFRNIKPASWMADMFPGIPEAGYDWASYSRAAYGYSRALHEQLVPKVDALLANVAGEDAAEEIKRLLAEHNQAVTAKLDAIGELVAQVASGESDAAAVVAEIARRLAE